MHVQIYFIVRMCFRKRVSGKMSLEESLPSRVIFNKNKTAKDRILELGIWSKGNKF